jgi:hypothetical protein
MPEQANPSQAREPWIPLGSRDLEFNMCAEMRRATVDLLRGNKPSSVLGILMANRDGNVTVDEMADQLGRPVGAVAWTIEKLEEEDLCERISHDGVTRVVAFAAYSQRNAV